MTYPSISIDKVDQEIHRFEQTPMAQPIVQQQQQQAAVTGTTSPVVPPQRQVTPSAQTASSPQAPEPNMAGMVSNVTSNFADMQKQMPEPQLPINDGLKILGGLGLLAAGGLGLNKLLSEKEPASVKPGSIESRKIGSGPQMNVNTGEPRMVGDLFPADVSTKSAGPTPKNPTVDLNTKINNKPGNFNLVEESEQNKLKNETANARKQESGSISDGMRNTYNKNTKANPNGPNPLGPKAYNWIAGQEGPKAPEVWKNLVGNKNISYDELQKNVLPLYEAYLGSYGEPDPFASVAKRGTYRTPARIPENIKGNASIKGMGSLAVMAAALGLGGSEKGQEAMAKAAKAIKDIGFSPDILTNKAEEMGRLGTGYVTAGNPVYRKELEQKLQSTNDPQYKKVLQEELDKISSSSNSPYRSVPPPR